MRIFLVHFLWRALLFALLGSIFILVITWMSLFVFNIGIAAYLLVVSILFFFWPILPVKSIVFLTRRKRWGFFLAMTMTILMLAGVGFTAFFYWNSYYAYSPGSEIFRNISSAFIVLAASFILLGISVAGCCIGIISGQQRWIDVDREKEVYPVPDESP